MAIVNPHGPGSFFGDLSLDLGVTSALPLPRGGLLSVLPRTDGTLPNNVEYGILTGVTEEADVPAADRCALPRHRTGLLKLCVQRAGFGRLSIADQGVNLTNFDPPNPCENTNVRLVGNPLNNTDGWVRFNVGRDINRPSVKSGIELFATMIRKWSPYIYTGDGVEVDPTFTPPRGLDELINTGHTDIRDATPCPRADSYILDWATDGPSGDIKASASAFYAMFRNMWWTLKNRAEIFGLDPAMWLPVMRDDLFRVITLIWPCEMATSGCEQVFDSTSNPVRITLSNSQAISDEMFNGKFLWIDGMRAPVLTDSAVPRTELLGLTTSQIYFVPIVVTGGVPATWIDYARWDRAYELGDREMRQLLAANGGAMIDQGRWLVLRNPITNGCGGERLLYARPRILLLTPQIAGRIINVDYVPEYQITDWDPNAPNYVNGGLNASPVV